VDANASKSGQIQFSGSSREVALLLSVLSLSTTLANKAKATTQSRQSAPQCQHGIANNSRGNNKQECVMKAEIEPWGRSNAEKKFNRT
jgi:hypothetical protein